MYGSKPAVITIALILIAFFCVSTVSAKTYKWKDAQGRTHYSQMPPPNGLKGEVLNITSKPPKPEATPTEPQAPVKVESNTVKETPTEATENPKLAEVRRENCLNAKHTLMVLENNQRVRVKEGENFRVIDANEQKSRIERLRKQIDELCQ